MLEGLATVHVAPNSVTRASLIDALVDAERTIVRPEGPVPITIFNSLFAAPDELGTFMATYEPEFMSTLNSLYDCRYYKERKRHLKQVLILDRPQLNLLAGTTPGWLLSSLPQNAWQEGFTSRMLLVYSNETLDDWEDSEDRDEVLASALAEDLSAIHAMFGLIRFAPGVFDLFKAWIARGKAPAPTHPRLEHYLPRRPIHLLKIAMCVSASRASDYLIQREDFLRAQALLFEVEAAMPSVFRDMKSGGDSNILDEAFHEVERLFRRDQRPVPEYKIVHFISKRAPSYSVKKILEVLYESNMVRIASAVGPAGRPTYVPVEPENHNETVSKDL